MRNSILAGLVAVGLTAGCDGLSSLNPMNMFGPSEDVEMLTPLEAQQYRRDPRPLMDQITDLVIEPSPGGAARVWYRPPPVNLEVPDDHLVIGVPGRIVALGNDSVIPDIM